MWTSCVRYLKCTDVLVTTNYLAVGVFDCWHIWIFKCVLYKSKNEWRLAHSCSTKDHHSVVVTLFGHFHPRLSQPFRWRSPLQVKSLKMHTRTVDEGEMQVQNRCLTCSWRRWVERVCPMTVTFFLAAFELKWVCYFLEVDESKHTLVTVAKALREKIFFSCKRSTLAGDESEIVYLVERVSSSLE